MQRRYVFGPGVDEVLVQYDGGGTANRSSLHADERGSIVAISDGSGAATQINRYDEYGRPQASNSGRFQYTGQMWLPELGLYHYKARAYAPQLGRFLQTDPVGATNVYAYVGNDPIGLSEPTGMVPARCGIAAESDELSRCVDLTPQGVGWGSHSYDWSGGSATHTTGRLDSQTLSDASTALARLTSLANAYGTTASCLLDVGCTGRLFMTSQSTSEKVAIANRIAQQELQRTQFIAPGGGHNDIYDAERHARWVYRMAHEIGPWSALNFSDLHEYQGLYSGQPLREFYMDLNNNRVGFEAWKSGKQISNIRTPGLIYFGTSGDGKAMYIQGLLSVVS